MDDLFGQVPQRPREAPEQRRPLTAEDVRHMMVDLVDTLRTSTMLPFTPEELRKHRAMVPIMAMWFEPREGAALAEAFERELEAWMTGDRADQLNFDLGDAPVPTDYQPNLAEIREDLEAILASARAVTTEGLWDRRTYRYNKVVFPQMSRWLPDAEREQYCFAFFRELERIELLMAA
jgi:hypothetical protein